MRGHSIISMERHSPRSRHRPRAIEPKGFSVTNTNLLREYETVFLVKPDLTDDAMETVKSKVSAIIDRNGGKFLRYTLWGRKKTMYLIAKQPRANYILATYLGGSNMVAEVERNLRNFDEVTRYLSRRIADDIDPATRQREPDVKLADDVDDNKPLGGAEREEFHRDDFADDDGPDHN